MARYSIIEQSSGRILNIIEWDGSSTWSPPKGCDARVSKDTDERYVVSEPAEPNKTPSEKLTSATGMTISEIKSALA